MTLKTEEQLKKELINELKSQAERLEKSDLESMLNYKSGRYKIAMLEDVLELNILNK